MNDLVERYIVEKMSDHRRGRDNANMRDRRDYEDDYYREDERDYYDRLDERRGVKGSGRGRMRDRMDNASRDRTDMADDFHKGRDIKLSKQEMMHWKRNMENTDGTTGEHYDMQQCMQAAEKLGIRFNEFTEKQFCLVVNMMYSDYGQVIKHFVSGEKELLVCAEMALAYLDDPDGKEPDEKLAMHYWCLTNLA